MSWEWWENVIGWIFAGIVIIFFEAIGFIVCTGLALLPAIIVFELTANIANFCIMLFVGGMFYSSLIEGYHKLLIKGLEFIKDKCFE